MARSRRPVTLIAAGVATPALVLAAGMTAQAATNGGWKVVSRHHFGAKGADNALLAVTAPTRTQAWAFGDVQPGNPPLSTQAKPLAEHWNGRRWARARLPAKVKGLLMVASASSPTNVWAAPPFNGYVLHWNGRAWSVAKRWPEGQSLPSEITGITALSSRDVWVFGGSGAYPGVGTWHLHGHTWTHVTGVGGDVAEASALSPRNMWAIGGVNGSYNAVLRYNGRTWKQATDPLLAGQQFQGIWATSATSIWVSALIGASATKPELLHFNGTRWRRVSMPWKVELDRFASDGRGGFWADGYDFSANRTWVVHMSGHGSWSRHQFAKGGPNAFTLIPGTRSLWGVGITPSSAGSDATVWRH